MRWIVFLACLFACKAESSSDQTVFVQTEDVQLAIPQLTIDSILFRDQATVSLKPGLPDATIFYRMKGPLVSPIDLQYKEPIVFKEDFSLYTKAFHKQMKPSDEIGVEGRLYKDPKVIKIHSSNEPKAPYNQSDFSIFFDGEKGSFNFREAKWLGFQEDSLEFTIELASKRLISEVSISSLYDIHAWIMNPSRIEVQVDGKQKETLEIEEFERDHPTVFSFSDAGIIPMEGTTIEVKVVANKLPKWHSGFGESGWLFIDEILIR